MAVQPQSSHWSNLLCSLSAREFGWRFHWVYYKKRKESSMVGCYHSKGGMSSKTSEMVHSNVVRCKNLMSSGRERQEPSRTVGRQSEFQVSTNRLLWQMLKSVSHLILGFDVSRWLFSSYSVGNIGSGQVGRWVYRMSGVAGSDGDVKLSDFMTFR